ncbi:hypothetical protein KFK09_009183 [Dendrobium nobile]|uniref:Uncharacterized protein n=1 Tax=Dendrobium nobile TaxID=94219 RepID=A0A8T3BN50_DENNO|nr:hypothetical protein KFK09_009183 [Dendrobium nobile]
MIVHRSISISIERKSSFECISLWQIALLGPLSSSMEYILNTLLHHFFSEKYKIAMCYLK